MSDEPFITQTRLQQWHDVQMKALVELAMQQNEQDDTHDSTVVASVQKLVDRQAIISKYGVLKELQVYFDLVPYKDEGELALKCPLCTGRLTDHGFTET
jgi:hypothetical protein